MYSTALIFGGLGGMISEKSGVVNIGIEGMMSVGEIESFAKGLVFSFSDFSCIF